MPLLLPCGCAVVRSLTEEKAHLLEGFGEGILARHFGLVAVVQKSGWFANSSF